MGSDHAVSQGSIYTPLSLRTGYFPFFKSNGAFIVSNSWGGASESYTQGASDVDRYLWENRVPSFIHLRGSIVFLFVI